VKWKMLARNSCEDAEPPSLEDDKSEIVTLSKEEVNQLLDAATDRPYFIAIFVAVNTGLRLGEVCGLRWQDVDWDRRGLTVQQSIAQTRSGVNAKTPKSGKIRFVPVTSEFLAELRKHRLRQLDELEHLGDAYRDLGLVSPNDDGTPRNPDQFTKTFSRFIQRSELPPITFHCLRHTFATLALEAAVPLKVVSEILGHSTIAITANIYQHVTDDLRHDAAEAVGKLLRRA
jgi:integrase